MWSVSCKIDRCRVGTVLVRAPSYIVSMSDASMIARFAARRALMRARRADERQDRAFKALPALVAMLAARGAYRVWLFGSFAWGRPDEDSDLDLAAEGLAADELLRAQGELLAAAPCAVDLVRIEEAPPALATRIRAQGKVVHG